MSRSFLARFLFLALLFLSNNLYAEKAVNESFEGNSYVEKWNSAEGLKRLKNSKFKNDFYQLANFYQPQENPIYCSAATAVMILNALNYGEIPSQKIGETQKPTSLGGGVINYNLFSQAGFFNHETDKIKSRDIIEFKKPKAIVNGQEEYDPGLTLREFANILKKAYHLKVTQVSVEKNTPEAGQKFRQILKKYLADEKNFLVANFDGKIFGNKTNGHISSIVAFDEASDSVLILDVALHKNPWYWVKVDQLYQAMNSKDQSHYRGYLIIRK